jgi:hypothetical protein
VPLIALITQSLFAQCSILALVIAISIVLMCIPVAPEKLPAPKAAFAPRHSMQKKIKKGRKSKGKHPSDSPSSVLASLEREKSGKDGSSGGSGGGGGGEAGYNTGGGDPAKSSDSGGGASDDDDDDSSEDDDTMTVNGVSTKKKAKKKSCPYVVEFLAGWEAFWLIGGKVAATSYLTTYVDDTDVISPHKASLLIVVLWIGISLGRLVGIFDQVNGWAVT